MKKKKIIKFIVGFLNFKGTNSIRLLQQPIFLGSAVETLLTCLPCSDLHPADNLAAVH